MNILQAAAFLMGVLALLDGLLLTVNRARRLARLASDGRLALGVHVGMLLAAGLLLLLFATGAATGDPIYFTLIAVALTDLVVGMGTGRKRTVGGHS